MSSFKKAKRVLDNHGVIAFPTETVMGFGVFYDDKLAYEKLNLIKQRKPNKPYTVMVANKEVIKKFAEVDTKAEKLIDAFMPGSITLLLRAKADVPSWAKSQDGIVGIRIPSNNLALKLLFYLEKPLLVPSANRADERPCKNHKQVKKLFDKEIDYIIKGKAISDIPSTIIDLSGKDVKIIREGPISFEEIKTVIKEN